ncbi:hypothetical protein CDAR_227971 [Caerostris darwini]|uniref:Uncharacterized protein n=1 Tax=Caerostris darwini TaxID=1538125 RepID=A0AAV4VDR4_9ARAC|nr:hypothetical protein CDAR_227971 [Caerostris darwini]
MKIYYSKLQNAFRNKPHLKFLYILKIAFAATLVENVSNHPNLFFKKRLRRLKNLARVIRLRDVTIIEHVSLPEHRNLENFNCPNYHRKTILSVALLAFDCCSETELFAERFSFEMPLGAIIASRD